MSNPTPDEIQKMQGTRLNQEKAPWETYGEEMSTPMDAKLAAEVEEYAQRRHDAKPTNQSLEVLAEQKEYNEMGAKQYQWVTPDEYADEEARKGRILHSSEFITTLRKADIRCWYGEHMLPRRLTLWVQREGLEPEVGCWVQYGFMPELSIMRFTEHGVPLDEKFRGWRTCLLQLQLKSIISESDAEKYFGKPNFTDQFGRYNSVLQGFRNLGGRLQEHNN